MVPEAVALGVVVVSLLLLVVVVVDVEELSDVVLLLAVEEAVVLVVLPVVVAAGAPGTVTFVMLLERERKNGATLLYFHDFGFVINLALFSCQQSFVLCQDAFRHQTEGIGQRVARCHFSHPVLNLEDTVKFCFYIVVNRNWTP